MMKLVPLTLILLLITSCHKKSDTDLVEHRKMGEGRVDVHVPTSVWRAIEKDYNGFNAGKKAEGGEGAEGEKKEEGEKKSSGASAEPHKMTVDPEYLKELTKKQPPSETFPFVVDLVEKTEGVLGKKNYELQYPSGGGLLDLASFISERPLGSFYFKLKWDEKEWPLKTFKVYFVSRSKVRVLDGKTFGSGCDHFYDLTDYWRSSMKGPGLFLNTNNFRHISLMAGIYYFNVFKEGKIYWASLEILDSRHRDLLCVPE